MKRTRLLSPMQQAIGLSASFHLLLLVVFSGWPTDNSAKFSSDRFYEMQFSVALKAEPPSRIEQRASRPTEMEPLPEPSIARPRIEKKEPPVKAPSQQERPVNAPASSPINQVTAQAGDFQYNYYLRLLQNRIKEKWKPPYQTSENSQNTSRRGENMISIIIPTYNSEATIERAIQSVIAQKTDVAAEIIICDDASTDRTIEICERLGVDRIIRREVNSGGPNRGRNAGLDALRGDRFCFLDHDDEFLPGALQRLSEIDAEIVFGEYYFKTGEKQAFHGIGDNRVVLYKENELFSNVLKQNKKGYCLPYLSGLLVSAELRHVRFEEYFGMMDFDYMLRLSEHRRAVKVNAPVFIRYSHGSNLSLNAQFRKLSYWFSSMTLENYYQTYPREALIGLGRLSGTKARYHYLMGDMKLSRLFFLRSRLCLKTILFLATSFLGSKYVKKHFTIFGT